MVGNTYISGDRLASYILTLLQNAKTELLLATYVLSDFKVSWQEGTLLGVLEQKLEQGIEVSILLGRKPPDYVRERLLELPQAIVKICPRAHLKAILVDGKKGLISTGNITGRGTTMTTTKKQNFEVAVSIGKITTQTLTKLVKNIMDGTYCTKKTCLKFENGECGSIKKVINKSG